LEATGVEGLSPDDEGLEVWLDPTEEEDEAIDACFSFLLSSIAALLVGTGGLYLGDTRASMSVDSSPL
jgi:hypothetical protein